MTFTLENVKIIDDSSPFHGKVVNIIIENGMIKSIGDEQAGQIYPCAGKWLSRGWIDTFALIPDPGFEHKEDLQSGLEAALAGGLTAICLQPNTFPAIDNKALVDYLFTKGQKSPVKIIVAGAISKNAAGESMAELLELNTSGAQVFSDGKQPVDNAELLYKVLQYAQMTGKRIYNRPSNPSLSRYGQIHEGFVSTWMGLKGLPSIAEYLMVQRDLSILEYTGGKLHMAGISCHESVTMIREAKRKGLDVTCDVPILNLVLTDEALRTLDTNAKVWPPLRGENDRKALLDGVADGTIDAICSNHIPQDIESKNLEFDLASFGSIGFQTLPALVCALAHEISLSSIINALTVGPAKILGTPIPGIEIGHQANFTIIDPEKEWIFDDSSNKSKSRNSILFGKELKGKAVGIVVHGFMVFTEPQYA